MEGYLLDKMAKEVRGSGDAQARRNLETFQKYNVRFGKSAMGYLQVYVAICQTTSGVSFWQNFLAWAAPNMAKQLKEKLSG